MVVCPTGLLQEPLPLIRHADTETLTCLDGSANEITRRAISSSNHNILEELECPPDLEDDWDGLLLRRSSSSLSSSLSLLFDDSSSEEAELEEEPVAEGHGPQQHKAPKLRVHFPLGSPVVGVYTYPAVPEELKPDLYWSEREKKSIKAEAQTESYIFAFEHSHHVDQMEQFFRFCGQIPNSTNATVSSKNTQPQLSSSVTHHIQKFCREWSTMEGRGLEHRVSSLKSRERKRVIAMVLQYQDFLRQQQQIPTWTTCNKQKDSVSSNYRHLTTNRQYLNNQNQKHHLHYSNHQKHQYHLKNNLKLNQHDSHIMYSSHLGMTSEMQLAWQTASWTARAREFAFYIAQGDALASQH
jgi:hypothetical protein